MKLVLDYRESDLIAIINAISQSKPPLFEITTENLPIGDIVIRGDNNTDLVVIERKTLQDLAASIRDGRYNEQSFRLDESLLHNHNIIYLIEGNWATFNKSKFNKSITEDTLLSSLVSINYFKGFSLFRTQTIEESAKFILKFIEKIQKESGKRQPYYTNKLLAKREPAANTTTAKTKTVTTEVSDTDDESEAETETGAAKQATQNEEQYEEQEQEELQNEEQDQPDSKKNYLYSIKKTKKEHITISNIGEIILSQIPNVSMQGAIAIMAKFKTIKSLIQHLETDRNCLNDVVTTNSGKSRRLNKTCINNVFKYLLQLDNDCSC